MDIEVVLSTESQELFKRLLKELRPAFKGEGFRASGQNFILESAECWVIINFQRSRWANRGEITFYINVAASSKRWLGFYGKPADKMPHFASCDWRWRVEQFGRDNIQKWTLRDEESLQSVYLYLWNLFRDFVFPATRTMTTEAGLMKHSGGFEYPQLKTRTVILAATNQIGPLKHAVAALIEKFGASERTREHLIMLRSAYPDAMRSVETAVD